MIDFQQMTKNGVKHYYGNLCILLNLLKNVRHKTIVCGRVSLTHFAVRPIMGLTMFYMGPLFILTLRYVNNRCCSLLS